MASFPECFQEFYIICNFQKNKKIVVFYFFYQNFYFIFIHCLNQTNNGSDTTSGQLAILSLEIDKYKQQVEDLESKTKHYIDQLEVQNKKDQETQHEKRDLENKIALLQHDIKQSYRKVFIFIFIFYLRFIIIFIFQLIYICLMSLNAF